MPAIKVYKDKSGNVVPVDDAKVAKAYRCPWTKEVLLTKPAYVKHLKALRENRMHLAARKRLKNELLNDLWNQPTFEDIIKWVRLHPQVFFDNAVAPGSLRYSGKLANVRDDFRIEITHLDIDWRDRVSNSHSCPRGGVTNWGGDGKFADGTPKPKGYPGWSGRIEFKISHDLGFGSDIMRGLGFNTGTGGSGGGLKYGFGVEMFASDWPGVYNATMAQKEAYERKHLLDMIKNEYVSFNMPSFKWGKPDYFKW